MNIQKKNLQKFSPLEHFHHLLQVADKMLIKVPLFHDTCPALCALIRQIRSKKTECDDFKNKIKTQSYLY